MKLEHDDIDKAVNKKYTDFSDKIKDVLHSKLNGHEILPDYTSEYDSIQKFQGAFSEINGEKGEE